MTHVFRHPKFYRIPRDKEEARAQLKVPSSNSDQAISLKTHDGECERAPDPGHKLGEMDIASSKQQASSDKPQATDPQASSDKLSNQPQASSAKLR